MKVYVNIENNGYWIPGNSYYVDVWEVTENLETSDYDSCPQTGIRITAKETRILRADSEIVADAGSGVYGTYSSWGADGDFTIEYPPVYDFTTTGQVLSDWSGMFTLNSSEVLKEGNTCNLVRYTFDVSSYAPVDTTLYLKMGSYLEQTCLAV